MSESDDEDEDTEFEVSEEAHTICHLCGGAGFIANPVQALIGDVPRTIDNGRPCPGCDQDGFLAGLVPPV